MLSVVAKHKQSSPISTLVFSRLLFLLKFIRNKIDGSAESKLVNKEKIKPRMSQDRQNDRHRRNFISYPPNGVPPFMLPPGQPAPQPPFMFAPGVPGFQPSVEESISSSSAFSSYGNLPYWQPMQPLTFVQPNLWQNYFHRPAVNGCQTYVQNKVYENNLDALRSWEKLSNDKKPGTTFSIMSYNVLAQDLLDQHPYLYNLHNKEYLPWGFRWKNLINEIKKFQPDILCLQEVQNSHLTSHFSSFEQLGYRGLYKQRTGIRTDGCAIYYKQSVFNLIEYTTVEYNQPNVRMLNRDNVALIAKLSLKTNPNKELVVATTHLLYNPKREDVRLAQIQLLLTELDRLSFIQGGQYLPVILTGDLNSTPDSSVYKFIANGALKYENLALRQVGGNKQKMGKIFLPAHLRITDQCQHADLLSNRKENKTLSRSEELQLIELKNSERRTNTHKKFSESDDKNLFSSGTLSHNFSFKSVYKHLKENDIEGTTFQDQWLTVDYIFFSKPQSKSTLELMERYRLPTKKELGLIKIPNDKYGSDHLSLMAKFKLKF